MEGDARKLVFDTYEDAVAKCQQIVDAELSQLHEMTNDPIKLLRLFVVKQIDPYVTPEPKGKSFSALAYAEARCHSLCGR